MGSYCFLNRLALNKPFLFTNLELNFPCNFNIKEKIFSFINLSKALAIYRANALKLFNNTQNHNYFVIKPCLQLHNLKNNV